MTPAFSGSYGPDDVTFLLKPVTLAPTDTQTRERLIQSGRKHYSETLAPEAPPTGAYLDLYRALLARHGGRLRADIDILAAGLDARAGAGREIVLASFARAGTPIGVLLVRALRRLGRQASHYSISIIRGRGLDEAAMRHITERHDPRDVVFLDGWSGKGAIARELRASDRLHDADPFLALVADPAGVADLAATADDYAIASGVLNATASGLISRSILNDEVVGEGDFHACVFYEHLAPIDESRAFIEAIEAAAPAPGPTGDWRPDRREALSRGAEAMVEAIMRQAGVADRNRVKPGIAEATRALLRRVPETLFLRDPSDPDVAHLAHLAKAGGVAIQPLEGDHPYRAVAVIRSLGQG